jgi:cytochrome c biogenesis protein CcmG/thiol:disulfide interchange protein DsbE
MRRLSLLLPLGIFLLLLAVFAVRLVQMDRGVMPNEIDSVMIDRPISDFALPGLFDDKPGVVSADLKGKVTLVNFFASWCVPCRSEHPLLAGLSDKVNLVGIAYKNDPIEARNWLAGLGNPYSAIATDRDGRVAIDFGLYGVPESYLIDRQGRIRYAWKKPFTPQEIKTTLLPLIAELSK